MTPAEAYRRDGAVVARSLFDAEAMAVIRRVTEDMLANPSPRAITASEPGKPAFVEDFCNWQRYPELIEAVRPLARLAAELTGSRTVRMYHDHVLNKDPGASQPTPWHQDQPFYNIDGKQNVSAWIPIDHVDEATTLRFVAGSHDGTWYLPTTFLDKQARWFPEGTLEPVPEIPEDDPRILGWALDPGDAVLFHMLTLHGAAGNRMDHARRTLSIRLIGDDIRHAPRPWRTSPPFEGLAEELAAGAEMDHPLFPVLVG